MKMSASLPSALILAAALIGASPALAQEAQALQSFSDLSMPSADVMPNPGYVRAIARTAYIWGWPMVNMINRFERITQAPEPGLMDGVIPVAPRGRLAMLHDYIKPSQRFVVCPNQDVVYGLGFFLLDDEPVVIQVPDFGDRFWVYALYDQRTDQFGELGKPYGSKPGFYLLVGPNWKGEVPHGITGVIRSSTSLANAVPRVFQNDTDEDRAAIQAVINQILAYPLGEFDGKMKTIDYSKLPTFPNPAKAGNGETAWVVPEKFFDQLPQVLKTVAPLPGEEALYAQFRWLLDVAAKDPAIKHMIVDEAVATEKEVIAPFSQWKYNGKPAGNGWNRSLHNAVWGVDYFNRTGTAKSNIFDNRPNETQYFYTDNDASGAQLDGAKTYAITFAAGQEPPVNGFWSMTLYNRFHFFSPNDLNRYSLGTKNKNLQRNQDGSLTLYAGAASPGKDKESNWLPAPNGPFSLYIRAYWGKGAILDGSWQPPKIEALATADIAEDPLDRFNTLANLPFEKGRPTAATAQTLKDELLFQRATQTYLWALPLINTLGMKVGAEDAFGTGYNIMPIWTRRLDAKTKITTPNSDLIYAMTFADLRQTGPLVFEAPGNLQGILLDFWQRPMPVDGGKFLGDVGLPGPDAGKGGNFLILPPGYDKKVPEGYYVYRSGTNNVFIFLRSFYKDPKDTKPAVDLIKRSRIYPLGQRDSAKAMVFPDASGKPLDMLPRSDASAFDQLKDLLDVEGTGLAGADWLGMLEGIGIAAGRPFKPDERTRQILDAAAKTAYRTSRVIGFAGGLNNTDFRVYRDRRWLNPINNLTARWPNAGIDLSFLVTDGSYRSLDARAWFFTDYYSISPGMVSMTPGKGAFYMIAFEDADGDALDGDKSYKLHLPANIPAQLFWSVTLYETENASGLDNGRPFPSLGKLDKPVQNADGSTDLYIAPKAPEGKAANWLATAPARGFFAILRLYLPEEAALDGSWKPGDIEELR